MPYFAHTPEALIPRSDSRNPATTCKGITSSGRPCRRALANSPQSSPRPSPNNNGNGVLAVLADARGNEDGAAAYFCWQHRDQANVLAEGSENPTDIFQLKERTSIDTLAERLGVLDIEDGRKRRRKRRKEGENGAIRRDTLPQQWQKISGPLLAVPEDSIPSSSRPARSSARPARSTKQEIHFSFFCCMRGQDTELTPPVKVRPAAPAKSKVGEKPVSRPPLARPAAETSQPSARPNATASSSYTQALLSFIPSHLPPATTSLLLSELSKPLSTSDHEPGFIYIFWLTPSGTAQPDASTASSLLSPPTTDRSRRTSEVLQEYAADANKSRGSRSTDSKSRTVMLKIGRASNVQRRMNQWARQCGHNVSIVRYYPQHRNSSGSPSPAGSPATPSTPHQVPLVARVERLIHVELQGKQVKRDCDGCGREHREWFEVEATREGLKMVDAVVKRWVAWAEQEASTI